MPHTDEKEAARLAEALRAVVPVLQTEGISDLRGIVKALNERGIQTPKGGRWHIRMVQLSLARMET